MKKLTKVLLILLIPVLVVSHPQGHPMGDITQFLGEMQGGWSIGNECGEDNYLVTNIFSDMDMKGEPLQVLFADITVHGELLNEGTIEYSCDAAIFTVLGSTLGEEEQTEEMEVRMFPNPATTHVTVQVDNLAKLAIYDMTGKEVKCYQINTTNNQIELGNLTSGTYLVRVRDTQDRTETLRLIKR